MTPPLLRPFGQPHGGTLSLSAEQVHNFQPTPEFRALARSLLSSRELAAEQGRSIFAGSRTTSCAEDSDCRPDLSRLPEAVAQTRTQAQTNPAFYRLSLNFLAAQFMNTTDESERARLQTQAREIAREALDRVSNPAFEPQAEDAHRRELPLRTRARMLFNIASTLSALLARSGAETYSEEDRALLRLYFVRTRSLVEELRERKRLDPQVLGWPEYFDHYLQAQIALIDGQANAAFSELIRTRQLLNEVPAESQGMPLPTQIRAASELALQSIPRSGSGGQAEALRNLISLEALGFVDQAQYLQRNGESSAPDAARRVQSLSLVAAAYLQAGHASPNVTSLLQHLQSQGNATALRQILSDRLRSDQALRNSLASVFSGDWNDVSSENLNRMAGEIISLAQQSAASILSHANEEPYRTLFSHDRDARPLSHAIDALTDNSALIETLRSAFGFEANTSAEDIVRDLVSHGENLPALLGTLPETTLTADANRVFFRELRQAALGLQGDGMRINLEQPLLDMVESVHGLAQRDDANAAAYFAIFDTLRNLEQVGAGQTLPPSLRRIAANHAADLQNFSASRVTRHLTAPSSLGMMAGGLLLSELAPIWLLRGARIPFLRSAESAAAVRSTGEMGALIRGGRLTGWGEAVAGLGVGLAMHLGSVGAHVVSARGTNVGEYGQELRNLGLMNLALGTLFSMGALGATMGAGHWLRGRLLPTGAALSPTRMALGSVGLRFGNWTVGGLSMLGAHSATAAISGHSAMPTGEQAAEVFLSMAMWDVGAAGLRVGLPRLFPSYARHQVGPYRIEQTVQNRLELLIRRNPELSGSRRFLQTYLRNRTGRAEFGRIGRAIEEGRLPRLEGRGDGRYLVFGEAPAAPAETSAAVAAAPVNAAAQPEPMSRTEAARTVLDITPDQQTTVRLILRSSAFVGQDNPDGIHVIRETLRDRLADGEPNPIVWVRVAIRGRRISFEALPAEPAAGDREGSFQMDSSGKVSHLTSNDPVLRTVMAGYNNNATLSPPILPPSAGADVIQSSGPEEPTAAHRRIPPQLQGRNGPVTSDSTAAPAEAPPADAPATDAPAAAAAEDAPRIDTVDDGETTAPRRPETALIDAARRSQGARTVQAVAPGRRPRGDNTVPFSTQQEARARHDSRPGESLPPSHSRREEISDPNATLQLSEREGQELRERLGSDLRPESEPASETGRTAAAAEESQPAIPLRDGEFQLEENTESPREDLEPLAEGNSEIDFSGLESEDAPPPARADSTPTIVPPAASGPRSVVQPPPLPAARPNLDSSVRRGSETAEPFLLLRRRVDEFRNAQRASDPQATTATSAVRVDERPSYERFAFHIDRFFAHLFTTHRETSPEQRYFDIEINPDGNMEIINGALMFRYENDGYSYFSLFRDMPNDMPSPQDRFLLERIHISDRHGSMHWDNYLRDIFIPMEPSQRRAQ